MSGPGPAPSTLAVILRVVLLGTLLGVCLFVGYLALSLFH